LVILIAAAVVLLLVLTMEAAGMRRSLRRIEREERRPVVEPTFPTPKAAPAGGWVLMAPPPDNVYAPLARWTLVRDFDKPFDTEAQCLVARNSLGRGGALGMPTPVYQNPRCIALVAPMPPGGPMEDMSLPANRGIPWTPLPDAQQAELDSAANITGTKEWNEDLMDRLKHLNLRLVEAGPELHNEHAVIMVAVEEKITPRIQEQFDEEMVGLGQGYPVLLKHEDPIKMDATDGSLTR
jgi:hypothetical protein